MKYVTFEFAGTQYKLRLTAQTATELERRLGQNPLDMLTEMESGKLPPLTSVLLFLHAAMQKFHHGITIQKVYEFYDAYVDADNNYTDLIPVLTDVLEVSGFFRGNPKEEAPEEVTK
ncbi:MAG: gene transfer agent family protein [Gorillibacterium sp.]|nr:gene transfer agent family protein [Gorillibacterium sp.]